MDVLDVLLGAVAVAQRAAAGFLFEKHYPGIYTAKAIKMLTFKLGFFLLVEGGGGLSAQILFILMTNPSHGGFEMLSFNAIRLPLLQLGFTVQGMSASPA